MWNMVKARTNITIDTDLLKEAQDKKINLSATAEDAIKKRLDKREVTMKAKVVCEFCGKFEEKATADDPIGMTWLWPDEKWICDSCLRSKIRSVPVAVY